MKIEALEALGATFNFIESCLKIQIKRNKPNKFLQKKVIERLIGLAIKN